MVLKYIIWGFCVFSGAVSLYAQNTPALDPDAVSSPGEIVTPATGKDNVPQEAVPQELDGANATQVKVPVVQEEVPVIQDPKTKVTPEDVAAQRAREEFEKLWESSIQNEMGEADITNDVNVQDIVEPLNEYRYASFGKRDPFVPPFGKFQFFSPERGQSKYELPVVNSLQRPLDQLSLSGVWQSQQGDYRALVAVRENDNTEEGVIAKVGDPFGPAGKIIEINSYKLVTRQYQLEQDGTRTFEDRSLYLGDPSEILNENARRTVMLGPGGRTVFRIESDLAGSEGVTRYVDAQTGEDITEVFLQQQEEEILERVGGRETTVIENGTQR